MGFLLGLVYGTVYLLVKPSINNLELAKNPIGQKPCVRKKYPEGFVCVCNATYCDNLVEDMVTLKESNQIILLTSSAVSSRLRLRKPYRVI